MEKNEIIQNVCGCESFYELEKLKKKIELIKSKQKLMMVLLIFFPIFGALINFILMKKYLSLVINIFLLLMVIGFLICPIWNSFAIINYKGEDL